MKGMCITIGLALCITSIVAIHSGLSPTKTISGRARNYHRLNDSHPFIGWKDKQVKAVNTQMVDAYHQLPSFSLFYADSCNYKEHL